MTASFNFKALLLFFIGLILFINGCLTPPGTPEEPVDNSESKITTDTLTVVTYNLLRFGKTGEGRQQTLKKILQYLKPDILFVCELIAQNPPEKHAKEILDIALNTDVNYYKMATFVPNKSGNQSNMQGMLYYNGNKLTLKNQSEVLTNLRDINFYNLYYKDPNLAVHKDTIFLEIYGTHLKAGPSASDQAERNEAVNTFRAKYDADATPRNTIFCGDFNFYTSSEAACQNLYNEGVHFFQDPVNQPGTWSDNEQFSFFHTQSPRFDNLSDGGASGGMDDRFDFLLISNNLQGGTKNLKYIPLSYHTFGNDGDRFNKSVNDPNPLNTTAPAAVLDSLHNMSDHLPVMMKLAVDLPE